MFVRVAPETGLFQAGGLAIDDDWDYAIGGPPTRLGDLLRDWGTSYPTLPAHSDSQTRSTSQPTLGKVTEVAPSDPHDLWLHITGPLRQCERQICSFSATTGQCLPRVLYSVSRLRNR